MPRAVVLRPLRNLQKDGVSLLQRLPAATDDSKKGLVQEVSFWRQWLYNCLETLPGLPREVANCLGAAKGTSVVIYDRR